MAVLFVWWLRVRATAPNPVLGGLSASPSLEGLCLIISPRTSAMHQEPLHYHVLFLGDSPYLWSWFADKKTRAQRTQDLLQILQLETNPGRI